MHSKALADAKACSIVWARVKGFPAWPVSACCWVQPCDAIPLLTPDVAKPLVACMPAYQVYGVALAHAAVPKTAQGALE